MKLKHEITGNEQGVIVKKIVPLFPDITENTDCYTFRHPQGITSRSTLPRLPDDYRDLPVDYRDLSDNFYQVQSNFI